MMRILITGCGRSGTQYLQKVMEELGLKAGHEKVYHATRPFNTSDVSSWWGEWQVECSWLAVPFLQSVPRDVSVWHVVRDPLKVLKCWEHHGLLSGSMVTHPMPTDVINFVQKALPNLEGSDLQRAIHYVLNWNRTARTVGLERERYWSFRIEDLSPEYLESLLCLSGYTRIKKDRIAEVLGATPKNVGGCCFKHPENTWDRILAEKEGPELLKQAWEYGYARKRGAA